MNLQEQLLHQLEVVYGKRNPNTSRFGSTPLGVIADQLCLSNSLLTKLLSGTATQGMYERCLKNLERINSQQKLQDENSVLKEQISKSKSKNKIRIIGPILITMIGVAAFLLGNKLSSTDKDLLIESKNLPDNELFDKFFNPEFDVPNFLPYVPNDKVQEYCPCIAYEGDWVLNKPYTIPIPFKKPGLYYVASTSNMKLKCSSSEKESDRGKAMHGFEIMKHELWMDSKQEPLVPKHFNTTKKQFTKDFYNLDFKDSTRFEKVADISSFFYNKILIKDGLIIRNGEPCGRYANYLNHKAINKYEVDVSEILNHVVGDMIKTNCQDIPNPFCNPNTIVEGESVLEFRCEFSISTENLGMGGNYPYTKGFKLVDQQYSHNLLCNCLEESD